MRRRQLRAGQLQPLRTRDEIAILEALYALEQDRDAWLGGVLEAVELGMGLGKGVGVTLYDVSADRPRVELITGRNITAEWIAAGRAMHDEMARWDDYRNSYRHELFWTTEALLETAEWGEHMVSQCEPHGVRDMLCLNGCTPYRRGACIVMFAEQVIRLGASFAQTLGRLAAHVSAAYRLRLKLEQAEVDGNSRAAMNPLPGTIEAILGPRGRVEHAGPQATGRAALDSLKSAVEAREWARGRARRDDPQRALGAWRGLVSARWSLVDRFERDGKRYILARENVPDADTHAALTARERQIVALAAMGRSNKLIAYELGISHATVRVLLARAGAKLGCRGREEIVACYRRGH